jgi:hypothetical protein
MTLRINIDISSYFMHIFSRALLIACNDVFKGEVLRYKRIYMPESKY